MPVEKEGRNAIASLHGFLFAGKVIGATEIPYGIDHDEK
jgi:hypothetical protein